MYFKLILGFLFLAFSLTPSLIPRLLALQGALGGISFATGYGIAAGLVWLWTFLEMPKLSGGFRRALLVFFGGLVFFMNIWSFSQITFWQNSIRQLMGMDLLDTAYPFRVILLTAVVAVSLLGLSRALAKVSLVLTTKLSRFAPKRVSFLIGIFTTCALVVMVSNRLVFKMALRLYDSSSAALDEFIEPNLPRPTKSYQVGSGESLVQWESLGRMGRSFVATGPTAEDIQAVSGVPSRDPLRVYVGLNGADTPEARADLALRELIRIGGFARSVLVIAVPTGTGWLDAGGVDTLEYMHLGDVATVAVQYSYLQSWVSLLVEPDYGSITGRALFRAIYDHWTKLPQGERPRLYLHGLSLGAFSSESSVRFYEMLADPINGALWAGPPFPSAVWRSFTEARQAGSPYWLPVYGDSSVVRFANQWENADEPGLRWGATRIVYLQYASDPITFFESQSLYREPEWMRGVRAPDVSPEFKWYPVVTFLQLILDMAASTSVPAGYGHSFSPAHYMDAWRSVTLPKNWSDDQHSRLKKRFAEKAGES